MPREISLIDAKPRPIAVVRVTTVVSQWPSQFRHELDKVYDAVKAGRVRQSGHNVMVYRPREDGRVDIECGIDTDARFEPAGEVMYSETPSGMAVTTAHIGPYQKLGVSYDALTEWSRENGHRLSGICWEVYGDWHEDPSQLRTDIFHLVRK
jgi:effector-binding domain-containing protein